MIYALKFYAKCLNVNSIPVPAAVGEYLLKLRHISLHGISTDFILFKTFHVAKHSSVVECSLTVRWVVGLILHDGSIELFLDPASVPRRM